MYQDTNKYLIHGIKHINFTHQDTYVFDFRNWLLGRCHSAAVPCLVRHWVPAQVSLPESLKCPRYQRGGSSRSPGPLTGKGRVWRALGECMISKHRFHIAYTGFKARTTCSTQCGLAKPYDSIGSTLAQVMLVAKRRQAITWTNVDLSSVWSRGIHLRAILWKDTYQCNKYCIFIWHLDLAWTNLVLSLRWTHIFRILAILLK